MSESNRTQMLIDLAPKDRRSRTAVLISCFVLMLLSLSWTALCAGMTVVGSFASSPALAIVSAIGAVALGLPYLFVILWLDRNEKEPIFLILSSLAWGAVVATSISVIFNTSFMMAMYGITGDEALSSQLAASFSAPPVEEVSKALALGVLYVMFRHHLDNVLDGVIYGALVGLGFAVFENFMYYVQTGSLGGAFALICLRGVVTAPGTHACFTAISGAGFGYMRVARRGWLRYLAPIFAVGLAIFVHFSWNTFTSFILAAFQNEAVGVLVGIPLSVLVLQVPFILLVLVVTVLALRHERKLIELYLGSEAAPVLHDGELARLVPARRRSIRSVGLLVTGRFGDYWLTRKRNARLVELAFEKWHMDHEAAENPDAARTHAVRIQELRRQLTDLAAPPA